MFFNVVLATTPATVDCIKRGNNFTKRKKRYSASWVFIDFKVNSKRWNKRCATSVPTVHYVFIICARNEDWRTRYRSDVRDATKPLRVQLSLSQSVCDTRTAHIESTRSPVYFLNLPLNLCRIVLQQARKHFNPFSFSTFRRSFCLCRYNRKKCTILFIKYCRLLV